MTNALFYKICSNCDESKPLDAFHNAANAKDGKQNYCKECCRSYERARWATNAKHRKRSKDYKRNRYRTDSEYRAKVRQQNQDQYKDPVKKARKKKTEFERVLKEALDKWGLTRETYAALEAKGCAICGGPPNGRGRYHFDHDHETGKFRGLLCGLHNAALGLLNEDPILLRAAADYIENHRNNETKKEPK